MNNDGYSNRFTSMLVLMLCLACFFYVASRRAPRATIAQTTTIPSDRSPKVLGGSVTPPTGFDLVAGTLQNPYSIHHMPAGVYQIISSKDSVGVVPTQSIAPTTASTRSAPALLELLQIGSKNSEGVTLEDLGGLIVPNVIWVLAPTVRPQPNPLQVGNTITVGEDGDGYKTWP